jgi:hypothetical protein
MKFMKIASHDQNLPDSASVRGYEGYSLYSEILAMINLTLTSL